MKRLLILAAAALLVGCVSQDDIHLTGFELTNMAMDGFTPKLEAQVSVMNDSRTALNVSKIAFQLVRNDGTKVADIVVPEGFKIKGRTTTDANVAAFVKFSDPTLLMSLISGGVDAEEFFDGLYIVGSARVKAGLMGKTIDIERMPLLELLEKLE